MILPRRYSSVFHETLCHRVRTEQRVPNPFSTKERPKIFARRHFSASLELIHGSTAACN